MVVRALLAIQDDKINETIDGLSSEEQDTAMKYIFKGLETGLESGKLLKWHASLTEKAGLGCIVRVLSDRKHV